jgi:hypothetical protein
LGLVTEHEWLFGQAATSPGTIGAGEVEESIKKQISRIASGSLEMTICKVFNRANSSEKKEEFS